MRSPPTFLRAQSVVFSSRCSQVLITPLGAQARERDSGVPKRPLPPPPSNHPTCVRARAITIHRTSCAQLKYRVAAWCLRCESARSVSSRAQFGLLSGDLLGATRPPVRRPSRRMHSQHAHRPSSVGHRPCRLHQPTRGVITISCSLNDLLTLCPWPSGSTWNRTMDEPILRALSAGRSGRSSLRLNLGGAFARVERPAQLFAPRERLAELPRLFDIVTLHGMPPHVLEVCNHALAHPLAPPLGPLVRLLARFRNEQPPTRAGGDPAYHSSRSLALEPGDNHDRAEADQGPRGAEQQERLVQCM